MNRRVLTMRPLSGQPKSGLNHKE